MPGPLPALPDLADALAHLEDVAEEARAFMRHAQAGNTRRAYDADWRHFSRWCARCGVEPLPADPQLVALYLYELAEQTRPGSAARTPAATIARRLSGLTWHFGQAGCPLDREDRHLKTMMAAIRRRNARPPAAKAALMGADLARIVGQIHQDLRGVRDRALLLVGFAGGLRRSEIVGLDHGLDETPEGTGWIEVRPEGVLVHIARGKTGAREVEIGRGSTPLTCPVEALSDWLSLARIAQGPVFRRVSRDGRRVLPDRLSDRFVARLVKARALAAGLRGDLSEDARNMAFAGHSLRAGLATSAEEAERHVQRQLGHASAEMTRRYQRRRDRFRINLTKAAGL